MNRILEVISRSPVKVVVGLAVAAAVAGCGAESAAPNARPADPLFGYWGITSVVQDSVVTYSGPGDEVYWVIYENETVCLIELLPSGVYEKDSTFVYEQELSRFIMRFDLDPIPTQPDTLTFRFSASSDTLYFRGAPTANRLLWS
jgi:hypothetical protein